MRVAIFGRSQLLLAAARAIHARGHTIPIVGTAKSAEYYSATEEDFASFAKEIGASYFQTARINAPDIVAQLKAADCEVAISLNWPGIVGTEPCASFRHGVFNMHAGDLPRYRGNAVANWAILNGESRVVFCLHQMDPDHLDTGAILARSIFPLKPDTYIGEVYDWLETETPKLACRGIDMLAGGSAKLEAQPTDPALALHCYSRRPEDSRIDWSQSSEMVYRMVRASSRPFAGAFSTLEGADKVVIWRAEPFEHQGPFCAIPGQVMLRHQDCPVIACGEGTLRITEATVGDDTGDAALKRIGKSLRNRLV